MKHKNDNSATWIAIIAVVVVLAVAVAYYWKDSSEEDYIVWSGRYGRYGRYGGWPYRRYGGWPYRYSLGSSYYNWPDNYECVPSNSMQGCDYYHPAKTLTSAGWACCNY